MVEYIPYLVNSFVEWCVDNNYKTLIVIHGASTDPQFKDIQEHVNDDKLVLTIDALTRTYFTIDDDGITFRCSAKGRHYTFVLPLTRLHVLHGFDPALGRAIKTIPLLVRPEHLIKQPEPLKAEELPKKTHVPYLTLVKKDGD